MRDDIEELVEMLLAPLTTVDVCVDYGGEIAF